MPPNMFNVTPVQSRAISVPFAAPRFLPTVGPGGPVIGVTGPFTAHGLCIARARDLTMYEPLSGSVVWVRHGLTAGCEIFGDDEVIIVATLRRPRGSGSAQQRRPSARHAHAAGRRRTLGLLRSTRLGLGSNAASEIQIESARSVEGKGANARRILGRLEGDDRRHRQGSHAGAERAVRDISLRDGQKLIDEQLEPEPMLHDIAVQAGSQQVVLIANRPSRHPNAANRVVAPVLMADPTSPLVSGHVYAFDAATGKPQWPAPAIVETHYALLSYGQDLPVILFLRPTQVHSIQGAGEIKSSVLFLDRRSGRAVHQEELAQPLNNMNFELVGDHRAKTVSLMLPNQTVTLHYTDDPLPPEPPYQAGLAVHQSRLGSTAAGARVASPGRSGA